MAKLQHRSVLYKITLAFIYFIFLVYALAFSIPTWLGKVVIAGKLHFFGLWVACGGDNIADVSSCNSSAFGSDWDWMDGVRGLWIAGMFFYVVAVVYSLVENCCISENSSDRGLTAMLAILAGLCGAVGVIVIAIKVEDDSLHLGYYWGYIIACISSGLTIILAIILLITRNVTSNEKSTRETRTENYVFAQKPGNPPVPEYTNHGYNYSHDEIPLANGVTYHHTPTSHPYTMYQDGYNNGRNPDVYAQPVKSPYGYYNGRPNHLHNPSDAVTDLSNGYTNDLINAEHTLTRSNVGQRADFVRPGGNYGKQDFPARSDYYPYGNRAY